MKKTSLLLLLALTLNVLCVSASPKREMRATWLTSVVNIDWPKSATTDIKKQKKELTDLLDACVQANMNTVLFHIRPACDALYKSKYEPWSSYLNHGRGVDPGYDPLQFCIEECHKRGLTCHGWINPYRYNDRGGSKENGYDWTGNNDTTKLNYKHTHPEWLLYFTNDIILDPGLPEVRQQIKNIVGDIINSYDIDGIIMDDYFYPYGGTYSEDKASKDKYKPADMQDADWRRQNVNQMIKGVYDTIQAVKPWVTFGVSPFGTWTSKKAVADKYGIDLPRITVGLDAYSSIYCDPIAWLVEGTVDYLSPQLYWQIGGPQDYKKLSRWWAGVCNRFGKHFYSSMALYRYKDGDSGFEASEIIQQIDYNRVGTDNAPGAVFYNTRAWSDDKAFKLYLTKNKFQHIALPPAINWKPTKERQMVENLSLDQQTLSWSHSEAEELHYAIYAIPHDSLYINSIYSRADMLLAVTYSTQYKLPSSITTSTHQIAVSVLDKYNNEYALRVLGQPLGQTAAATQLLPANKAKKKLPFTFSWQPVEAADSYIIQVAKDPDMKQIIFAQETTEPSFETSLRKSLEYLPFGEYYWRVKTRIPNAGDIWSDVQVFSIDLEDALDDMQVSQILPTKWIKDGRVFIQRGDNTYDMLGNIIDKQ